MHKKSSPKISGRKLWPTPNATEKRGRAKRSAAKHPYGESLREAVQSSPISESLTASSSGASPSLQGDFLASLSALPGSNAARRMIAISGRKCSELSRKPGPLGLWLKMCLASSAWSSEITFLTWQASTLPSRTVWRLMVVLGPKLSGKESLAFILLRRICRLSDTPSKQLLFRLVPSMPAIGGIECGLLPTPRGEDAESCGGHRGATNSLTAAVKLWPTTQARDYRSGRARKDYGNARPLNEAVLESPGPGLWNTPKAADVASQGKRRGGKRRGEGKTDLANQVKLWPTPRNNSGPSKDAHHLSIDAAVKLWPTPAARDHFPPHTADYIAEKRAQGHGVSNLNDSVNGQLNPAWVEWLQGFPIGWTDLKDSATPSSHKSRSKSSKRSPVSNKIDYESKSNP